MKMNKLFLTIAIVAVAFVSCKKSSDGLTSAIPADAAYVAQVDVESLVKKSDYDIFKNETVQRGINMAKGMLGKQEAVNLLDALTKDVNALGLNIKGNIYVYSDYKVVGIIAGVNDAEKFKQALIDFSLPAEAIEKENGTYILSPDRDVVVAWTSDKFLFLGNFNRQAKDVDLKAAALKQLTQGADESINSNPAFAEFLADTKDISVFYTLTKGNFDFAKTLTGNDSSFPKEISDIYDEFEGVAVASYISFEKGEIAGTSKAYYPNSDVEKKYKDLTAQMMDELKGEQLKLIPENAIFAASTNIKGAGVLNYIDRLGMLPYLEKRLYDEKGLIKTILNEVDGDITIALNDIVTVKKSYEYGDGQKYEYDSTEPQFTLMVDTKDGAKALDLLKAEIAAAGGSLTEIAPATYSLKNAYFAVKGNTLSVTNSKASLDSQPAATTLSALGKGKMIVVGGDIKPLKEIALKNISDEDASKIVGELIDLFDTYDLTSAHDICEGKIILTDKSQNSLAAFCQWLDKTLTSLNSKMSF